jgi:hypothetical protein
MLQLLTSAQRQMKSSATSMRIQSYLTGIVKGGSMNALKILSMIIAVILVIPAIPYILYRTYVDDGYVW